MRRREISTSGGPGGPMPDRLCGSLVLLARAFADPAEPVPGWWVRDDAASVCQHGTRAEQEARRRSLQALRRAEAAQDEWAAARGWTRKHVLGMRHPEWIRYGWADEPPVAP